MKAFITPAYTFTPGAADAGTLDLSAIPAFDIKRLVAVINQTSGEMVYSTGSVLLRHDGEAGGVVTLHADTSSMDAGDDLQVIYDSPDDFATEDKQDDIIAALLDLLAAQGDLATETTQVAAGVLLQDMLDELVDLNAVDFATEAKQDDIITELQQAEILLGGLAEEATLAAQATLIGAVNEAAPGTDVADSGLNGRLKRIAQNITSLIGLLPASLGQKADASSLSVVLSTEQETDAIAYRTDSLGALGAVNETAPATDIASSGLNGRLQRIAQRVTSLIALLPASLGQKTMANSLAVTMASDQGNLPTAPVALVGSYAEIVNLTNVAQTFVAPAGAKWAKVQTDETNATNIRVKIGAAATVSSGMQFQAGRSEDYIGVGNISVIAETAEVDQKVYVQWGV